MCLSEEEYMIHADKMAHNLIAMKTRAELAFDKFEAELMKTVKGNEALSEELHSLLVRAREEVMQDDSD